jgi:CubicO group peptidase (beta-lactamase class C family)
MRGFKSVLIASTLLTLTACGGGGGGGGNNNPPPAPPAQNAVPVVNAGADATTTLPNATLSLSGSATDDGPASSLTYQWSANPATGVTFSAATSAATNVSFTTAGAYTLTLTVGDGTQSGTDTLVVTVNDAPAQAEVWPADDDESDPVNHGWAKVDAATVGMTQAGLDTAATFAQTIPAASIAPGTTVNSGTGMIVRHGQLVHSWGDIDVKFEVKSVTKSMGGILFGLALDQNKVVLRGKGTDYMGGAFGVPPDANAAQAPQITLSQLATHTSGFQKDDGNPTAFTALIKFTPGSTWSYSDAGLNWLADVLTTVYAQDLRDVAQANVWGKIGLNRGGTNNDDVLWRTNLSRPPTRNGAPLQYRELSSGISANANAMARVGLMFLRKGKWKDQQILSEAFVTQTHTPLPENATLPLVPNRPGEKYPNAQTDYGVLWWTNKSGTMPNVPTDTFWAWGLGEELIVVIPSLDLVIVRTGGQATAASAGRTWNDLDWDGDVSVLTGFLDPIVAATTP